MGKKHILKKVDRIVQLLDIAPTILDYFGIPIPDNFQGKSLLPLTKKKIKDVEKYNFSECYQKNGMMKRNKKEGFIMLSIRSDDWKYIFDEEKNQEFLFNLSSDPREQNNLINRDLIKANEFREVKDKHLNEISIIDEKSKIIKSIETLKLKF